MVGLFTDKPETPGKKGITLAHARTSRPIVFNKDSSINKYICMNIYINVSECVT